jgi:threonine dehydrogenase-like Zn-dependent dehydrogenase
MKSRTAVFTGPKAIEIREIELPPIGPNEVLVKMKACALCTWEQRFYKGSASEDYPFRGGHEAAGVVVEVGKDAVIDLKSGDTVALAIMTRCGACGPCRRGMDNFCEYDDGGTLPGQPWGPGGLSDYVIMKDYQVYKASQGADFAALALSEPVACVSRSVRLPNLVFGDTVLVQGAGIMGLLHVMLLKKSGVRVMVSEPDAVRRAKAMEIGADFACDPLGCDFTKIVMDYSNGEGAKAAFFTAGGAAAIEQALPALSKGGWLCLYGSVHPKGPIQIDPNFIHYNELIVTGTFSHTKAAFRQAVSMLSEGLVDMSPFITERISFPAVTEGFERAISPDTYRVVMTFDD